MESRSIGPAFVDQALFLCPGSLSHAKTLSWSAGTPSDKSDRQAIHRRRSTITSPTILKFEYADPNVHAETVRIRKSFGGTTPRAPRIREMLNGSSPSHWG